MGLANLFFFPGIITSVDRLRENSLNGNVNLEENEEVTQLLSEIHNLWQTRRPRYVCIGTMNGIMELLINICSNVRSEKVLISALKTLGSIIFGENLSSILQYWLFFKKLIVVSSINNKLITSVAKCRLHFNVLI